MSGYYFNLPREEDLTIGQQIALEEPNPIAISGGPGTGKSVVSLWRHIRNYKAKLQKNAGIINRNRNNSASCTDNKRITLKISEIREIAI